MQSINKRLVLSLLASAAILLTKTASASDQQNQNPVASSAAAQKASSPDTQLAWETDRKEMAAREDQLTADFSFSFTNISETEVVIDHVKTSCSCTVAKLPSEPWHRAPHTNGQVSVSVDLKGKMSLGEFEKKITVFFADQSVPPKELSVKIKMPDRNLMRTRNVKLAQADRQAVFKGDCAKCHAAPAKTATGMALYHDVCGICHEARPRATMVPDLRAISQHPTDYAFWKTMIANGKPGSLMPAFAINQGGPLTDEQIDSLARTIDKAFPYSRFQHPPEAAASPTVPAQQIANPSPPLPKN